MHLNAETQRYAERTQRKECMAFQKERAVVEDPAAAPVPNFFMFRSAGLLVSLFMCGSLLPGADAAETNKAVVSGNTAFAVELYKKESAKPGNLFFSPYCLSTALAMTYSGARGQTAEEMARVLHFPLPPRKLAAGFAELVRRMDEIKEAKAVELNIANSLWCQQGYSFLPDFLMLTRDFYRAEARIVDFVRNSEAARREINSWVANATQDKIQDLLHEGDLKPNTLLVLCNAVYFKGKWIHRFDAKATQPAPFFITSDRQVQTPLMSQTLNLRSKQLDDATLFALPY